MMRPQTGKVLLLRDALARGEFAVTAEVTPPRGADASRTLAAAASLKGLVHAVNVTDGSRAVMRMSSLALCRLLLDAGIEPVLQMTCRDRNRIALQADLLGAHALGIRNILAVTGDPPKLGNYPDATAVFDVDAIGLTNLVKRLNHGLDLAGNPIGDPTGFCVGVGLNPGAINLDEELRRLDWKIEAGAEFIITQPVFDVAILERCLRRIEHVRLPILGGIWPLVSFRNAEFMNNEVPGASVPADVMERMRRTTTKEEGFAEGVKIARETYEQIRGELAGVQLSAPMGRIEGVFAILG